MNEKVHLSPITIRFKEFLDLKYRGKFRAFATDLKIPHSWIYQKYKEGRLTLEDYMYKRIGERWPDVDINYLQTGKGVLLKNISKAPLVLNEDDEPFVPKKNAKDEVSLLLYEVKECKDEVIKSKNEVIAAEREIKKVLYEYNAYLKDSIRIASR